MLNGWAANKNERITLKSFARLFQNSIFISAIYPTIRNTSVARVFRFEVEVPSGFHPGK